MKQLLRRLQRHFWRYFFRIVVFTGALAEWVCVAWVLIVMLQVHVPWPMHIAGPVALHLLNRSILGARPGPAAARRSTFVRAYVGVVFTSLFGLVVLLANGVVWGIVAAALGIASSLGSPVAAAQVAGPAEMTGSIALALVASMIAWGYGPGQRRLRIVELDVELPGLAPAFDGYRIAQISDIHLGGYTDDERLARHIERVNDLGADLVCITGDITDGLDHVSRTFPILDRLRAADGVVAILGNHDFYTGADAVTAALRRLTSIHVLRNETFALHRDGATLKILGVDDAGLDWTRGLREHPDVPPLAQKLAPGEPSVLLSHRPDGFAQAARLGIGLVLSGHTHGGQLALPWPASRPSSLAHFISDFPRGTYQLGDSTLHVNLGLGVTGQPVRIASPREITLVTLRSPSRLAS